MKNSPPESSSYPHEIATFADGRKFMFKCVLYNGETTVVIQKDTIDQLVIEDTTFNWYSRGYIDIKNPRGALENSVNQMNNTTRDTYIFRNDSKDFLYIYMIPNVFETSQDMIQSEEHSDMKDDFYMLEHTFVVYSVKDITPDADENNKIKRLYLTDWRHDSFDKYNNTFTTSAYLSGDTAHWADDDRKIPTGDAIKHLIQETIPGEQVFSPAWELGVSVVDYTSPANNTSLEDLQDLVNMHVSDAESGSQPCVLYLDRANHEWSLVPISTMFNYASSKQTKGLDNTYVPGIWQSEQFVIGMDPSVEEANTLVNENQKYRVPQSGTIYFNYNFGADSCIQNYRFVEMHGDKNQSILNTRPVHQYNNTGKRFNINMSMSNSAYLSRHLARDVFTGPPADDRHRTQIPISANVDQHRFENLTIEHLFTSNDEFHSVLSTGRNNTVRQFLHQSNAIEFTVPGQTTRRSNRFISVQHNTTAFNDTTYNDKVDGQYLVAGVTHQIKNNLYTNKVVGLKPYNFNNTSAYDEQVLQLYAQDEQS